MYGNTLVRPSTNRQPFTRRDGATKMVDRVLYAESVFTHSRSQKAWDPLACYSRHPDWPFIDCTSIYYTEFFRIFLILTDKT